MAVESDNSTTQTVDLSPEQITSEESFRTVPEDLIPPPSSSVPSATDQAGDPRSKSESEKASGKAPETASAQPKRRKEREGENDPCMPKPEREAFIYSQKLLGYIEDNKGQFLRDEDGSLHLIIAGKRIPLRWDPENYALASLMLTVCGIGTLTPGARAAVQRIQVEAAKKAGKMRLRRFSALSDDGERLYIPVRGGQLLLVTADKEPMPVANGENQDFFWVEHPCDEPMEYTPGHPKPGLELFEQLLVETQACAEPDMRLFVAMHEGFFPYVRDSAPARFILEHRGPTQQGKTTGAERFTLLHGLGKVKGDVTVAGLASIGDIGLLVVDNKEQTNLDQPLIDFLLFLSTGAERIRATQDGKVRMGAKSRPVGVLTCIEGVWKAELQARCPEVEYRVVGDKIGRAEIETGIKGHRHKILSAIIHVLQRFLQIRKERRKTPNPLPDFEEHLTVLCDLLRAYGELAGKPQGWAEELIEAWDKNLRAREVEENELEHPLREILLNPLNDRIHTEPLNWQGRPGKLYVTECGHLLAELQRNPALRNVIPKTPPALGRRLRSIQPRSFVVLDEESAPKIQALKRSAAMRPIGFFFQDDGVTERDSDSQPNCHPVVSSSEKT